MEPTRSDAWELLTQHTKNPSLLKHALAVEAAMRHYAAHFNEPVERWGITGLIHDVDFEEHPTLDEHPMAGVALLRELGWPEDIIYAVQSHGTDESAPRLHLMDKALYAVDELTGLLIACAMVRPDKSINALEVSSVKKKWKDKAFARGVNRQDIEQGAQDLGIDLQDHIAHVIIALRSIAADLDLN
ncbi:MAG: HDIG domain-containing protein [Chloroflexi bacterium]|nr:HDIG domain-containing protein [Chloroflexota bacterium]